MSPLITSFTTSVLALLALFFWPVHTPSNEPKMAVCNERAVCKTALHCSVSHCCVGPPVQACSAAALLAS